VVTKLTVALKLISKTYLAGGRKSLMVTNIYHESRNILCAASGLIDLLKHHPASYDKATSTISSLITRLAQLLITECETETNSLENAITLIKSKSHFLQPKSANLLISLLDILARNDELDSRKKIHDIIDSHIHL
jgi:hypothetical protein